MKIRLLSYEEVYNLAENTKVYHINDACKGEVRDIKLNYMGYKKVLKSLKDSNYKDIESLDVYDDMHCETYEWIDDSKVLIRDQITNLEHGTKIKFIDNYMGDTIVQEGIINQIDKMIGGYEGGSIDNCIWNFDNLEERDVKAWIVEEPKETTASIMEKIEKEIPIKDYIKQYNIIEMVEDMKITGSIFKDVKFDNVKYALINNQLKYCTGDNVWHDTNSMDDVYLILKKFIKIEIKQTPVDFITAIESGKKIRVEHELIEKALEYSNGVNTVAWGLNDLNQGKYVRASMMLTVLSFISETLTLKDIISNGKWYIEEELVNIHKK